MHIYLFVYFMIR